MLDNFISMAASLPPIEPFYGLALTFYPNIALYVKPNLKSPKLTFFQRYCFDRIKNSVGLKGEIALYRGDIGECLAANKWTNATPVLLIPPQFSRTEDWREAPIAFSLRRSVVLIKHRHSFISYLAWIVCLVVGAEQAFQKKKAILFISAYFIGKYLHLKIRQMQIHHAETEVFALYNPQQLKTALDYFSQAFHSFQDWRSKSLWHRLVYLPGGPPRTGGMLWEDNIEPLACRLEKIKHLIKA